MLGPTGTGALYGRKELLEELPPYQVGGGMVRKVERDLVEYEKPPEKFEAGTQNIAGAAGLKEAAEYLEIVGRDNIRNHERELVRETVEKISRIEGVDVISPDESSMISFTADFAHPHDVAEIMNQESIAVRAGHHCAQPQMQKLDINGSVRISPYLYSTQDEMDKAVKAVKKSKKVFG
jgi:cysteine desulfurase/selenocysteine lyase